MAPCAVRGIRQSPFPLREKAVELDGIVPKTITGAYPEAIMHENILLLVPFDLTSRPSPNARRYA